MKKTKDFKVGDKVFAKVKGYPAWPARVTGINGKKYNVEFYGTKETGLIKGEDLCYYLRNKEKYAKSKRIGFPEAVEQIELAIKKTGGDGDDGAIDEPSADESFKTLDSSSSSLNSSKLEKTEKKPGVKRKRESTEEAVAVKKSGRRTLCKRESSEVKEEEATNDAENEKMEDTSKTSGEEEKIEPETENNQKSDATPEKENLANSEDSIVTEVVTKEDIVSENLLKNNILYAEHIRKNPSPYKKKPVEARVDTENQILPITTNSPVRGIKLHKEWPLPDFKNEFERAMHDETVAKEVLEIKEKCDDNSTTEHKLINISMSADDIKEIFYENEIKAKKERIDRLKIEADVVSLDSKIKSCLGLDTADPKTAVGHLNDMLKIDFDELMLKKHPHVVEMARRLRKYIGNTKEWSLSEKEVENFRKDAEKIREVAEKLYSKIKKAVNLPEGGESFWDSFQNKIATFREECKDLTEAQVYVLCSEPTSRKSFMDNLTEPLKDEVAPLKPNNNDEEPSK